MAKNPKTAGGFAAGQKEPRIAPIQEADQKPVWRFGRIDFGGPWCPAKSLKQDKLVEITKKMGQLESQTWPDLGRHGCHNVAVYKLCREAQHRLKELKLDELDEIYSLRLSGANRLWGLKIRNVFVAIWWDPDHIICPALRS